MDEKWLGTTFYLLHFTYLHSFYLSASIFFITFLHSASIVNKNDNEKVRFEKKKKYEIVNRSAKHSRGAG